MSSTRWARRSALPPKYPDSRPIRPPTTEPSTVERSPTTSETRAIDNAAVDVPPEMIAPEPVPGARGLERVGRIRLDRIIGGERSREDGTERHDEHQRPADRAEGFPPAEPSERAPRRQAGDGTRDRDRCRTRDGAADAPTWHIGYAGRARRRGGRPRGW